MSRYMTLEQFRKRFRVVDPLEAAAREPHKYFDPFVEKEKEIKESTKEN